MKIKVNIVIWFVLCFAFAKAQTIPVNDASQLSEAIKKAQPGDTIVMVNKEWKDVDIKFKAIGTSERPIVLKSQTAGSVKLTGTSTLRIGGDYLEVHGLWFENGNVGKNNVVRFEADRDTPATNSRLTNCAIINVNPDSREITNYYIALHGKNNRVDHCSLLGKLNKGPAIAVRLKNSIDNNHRIDHNYFGERLPLGFNGGETIRIGTSTYSKQSSRTIVENNFFERCSGEIEIISIKSAHNVVRNNLILESEGTITLRHGDYNIIEGNVIIGNNLPKTGGIRMINKGNIVRNNIIIGTTGKDLRAPICVMNGIPNSKLNEYDPVVDGIIQNNTIINCSPVTLSIGSRSNATIAPVNTKFENNLIYNSNRGLAIFAGDDISGITLGGNKVSSTLIEDFDGVDVVDFKLEAANGIYIPSADSDALLTAVKTNPKVRVDATGALRSQLRAGAIVPGNFKPAIALTSQAGVSFIKIDELRNLSKDIAVTVVDVAPGEKTLEKAIKNMSGPTILKLTAGDYFITKAIKVSQDLSIVGHGNDKTFLKISKEADKTPQYIFRLNGAKEVKIKGIHIDGYASSETVKYGITSSNSPSSDLYNLYLDDVTFVNFKNSAGGAIFKAYAGTKADTISIKNSTFKDSYRGLNLSYEKDETGKYNAEHIIIQNSLFVDIEQFAVNYTRSGIEARTSGGNLLIDHCVFYRVDDSEKGRIIKVNGIKNVHIKNSVLDNSRETNSIVQLKGNHHIIENCVVYNSGKVKLSDSAQEINLERFNPKWENTENFKVRDGSGLINAGTDQKNIGLINND
ncbi:polysaccharide lyase 6 family protein [Nonlabens ulvanivorans]|uniref:polysaccharide lyase 6 family protein n=1 Tax=Nonlabens ulvanivorans TaxID=906888 RepID=UPI002942C89A|nr:chondroitinase-B domain-containing protein [Nonlabens ulvanivorans]WOI21490.1 chondroitinase-B domain-containing protein [Nonlabens ulvanivorans]